MLEASALLAGIVSGTSLHRAFRLEVQDRRPDCLEIVRWKRPGRSDLVMSRILTEKALIEVRRLWPGLQERWRPKWSTFEIEEDPYHAKRAAFVIEEEGSQDAPLVFQTTFREPDPKKAHRFPFPTIYRFDFARPDFDWERTSFEPILEDRIRALYWAIFSYLDLVTARSELYKLTKIVSLRKSDEEILADLSYEGVAGEDLLRSEIFSLLDEPHPALYPIDRLLDYVRDLGGSP